MVEGQCQNCWSIYKCCPLNIFSSLCFKVAKHGKVDAPIKWVFSHLISGHKIKGQGHSAYRHLSVVNLISHEQVAC